MNYDDLEAQVKELDKWLGICYSESKAVQGISDGYSIVAYRAVELLKKVLKENG